MRKLALAYKAMSYHLFLSVCSVCSVVKKDLLKRLLQLPLSYGKFFKSIEIIGKGL
jgi:hypothetical protein